MRCNRAYLKEHIGPFLRMSSMLKQRRSTSFELSQHSHDTSRALSLFWITYWAYSKEIPSSLLTNLSDFRKSWLLGLFERMPFESLGRPSCLFESPRYVIGLLLKSLIGHWAPFEDATLKARTKPSGLFLNYTSTWEIKQVKAKCLFQGTTLNVNNRDF